MNALSLDPLWSHIFTHLWQSTAVLLILWATAWTIRGASSRLQHALWGLALLKFLVPFPLFQSLGRSFEVSSSSSSLVQNLGAVVEPVWIPQFTTRAGDGLVYGVGICLTFVWAIGAVWILKRTFQDWRRSRELLRRAQPWRTAAKSPIWLTDEPVLPAAVGVRRGIILLPRRILAELSPVELRSVLLHEQAHIDRRDVIWTLLQRVAFALFFFFPPLWFVLSQLHRKAELACDEAALRAGVEPRALARALARTLRLGLDQTGLAPTLGTKSPSVLSERLHRLNQPRRYITMRRHRMILTLAVIGVGVLTLFSFFPGSGGPLTALAEENATEEAKIDPPRPIAESVVYPEFPEEARLLEMGGKVFLRARISEAGEVTEVTEVSGIEGCGACSENAITALRQWRFEPATNDGVPTAFEVVVPFMYALENETEGESAKQSGAKTGSEDSHDAKGK